VLEQPARLATVTARINAFKKTEAINLNCPNRPLAKPLTIRLGNVYLEFNFYSFQTIKLFGFRKKIRRGVGGCPTSLVAMLHCRLIKNKMA
jgi:hypothetical protein